MTNVGEMLRRERLRQGLKLDEVARDTKIRQKLLEAIEDDQFDRLPGGVFAKSFVKQYAAVLGLDGEELAAEVQRQIQPAMVEVPAERPEIEPVTEPVAVPAWETMGPAARQSSSPWGALALVVAVVVVCSFAYNWWAASQAAPSQQTVSSAAREAEHSTPAASDTVQPEPGPATQAPTVPVAAKPHVPVLVTVSASEDVWVSARADGEQVFAETLGATQTRTIEAQSGVRLVVGNAGGLSVTLNGKPVGEIGPRGQVRVVELTPEGAQVQERRQAAVAPIQDVL